VVLGGLAAGVVGFLWYRAQHEPPIDGEGGPDEPQPPTGPEDFEEVPPGGAAATTAGAAASDESIFPAERAAPDAAAPEADADAAEAPVASNETQPVDIGVDEEAPPRADSPPGDADTRA
jgi:hypothetical protein